MESGQKTSYIVKNRMQVKTVNFHGNPHFCYLPPPKFFYVNLLRNRKKPLNSEYALNSGQNVQSQIWQSLLKLTPNNGHLSITDKFFKTRRCPLFRGFTIKSILKPFLWFPWLFKAKFWPWARRQANSTVVNR